MALIICPECNKEVSDQAKTCPHCGYKLPKQKRVRDVSPAQKKKRIAVIAGAASFIVILGLLYFFVSPYTVEWFCFHRVQASTCTEPQNCPRCGKTWGDPDEHQWKEATCTKPKTCTVCGTIEGSAKGHHWQEASCIWPKRCTICKATEGSEKGHNWSNATCTVPKKCRVCGRTEGSELGHDVEEYICNRCGITVATAKDIPNILDITSMTHKINYVGGIDKYMTFKNKSSTKTINYITIEMEFFNAVGDLLHDDISDRTSASLVFTGPLEPGHTSSNTYWRACFYNATYSGTTGINKIEIEYSDGTTLILNDNIAEYAVVSWRY